MLLLFILALVNLALIDNAAEVQGSLYTKHSYCVAVLTGYPTVPNKRNLLMRTLNNVMYDNQFSKYTNHKHLFCQGDCSDLENEIGKEFKLHFLKNDVRKDLYVGFIISENYRLMLREIFQGTSCGQFKCEYCLIIEDDLLFSPDAFRYFEKGINIMEQDKSIFAASAYNDNSYPWISYDKQFFRRVDHFSGYGFILSQHIYNQYISPNWNSDLVWDAWFHEITVKNGLVCIQPEVNRVMHARDMGMKIGNDKNTFNAYDSQKIEDIGIADINLSLVSKDLYDQYIQDYIQSAVVIQNIFEAGFYTSYSSHLVLLLNSVLDIDRLFYSLGLQGRGLGGVLRGVFKDTVFIRPFNVQLLIVAKSSPFLQFYKPRADEKHFPKYSCEANTLLNNALTNDLIPEQDKGAIYWLLTQTIPVITSTSCTEICREKHATCRTDALWIANLNCHILKAVFSSCKSSCKYHDDILGHVWDNSFTRYLPAIDMSADPPVCKQQRQYFYQCDAKPDNANYQRLCVCFK